MGASQICSKDELEVSAEKGDGTKVENEQLNNADEKEAPCPRWRSYIAPSGPQLSGPPSIMYFALPAPDSQFASSYEKDPGDNFAFLIPGDEQLFVGGGALNGAVGKLLLKDAGQPIAFELEESGDYVMVMDEGAGRKVAKYDKQSCGYRKLHEYMFQKARKAPNKLTVAIGAEITDRMDSSCLLGGCPNQAPVIFAGARVTSESEWPFGAIFLDIFKDDKRPFGCPRNVGLMYTAGPLGRNKRAEGEGVAESFREAWVRHNAQDFVHDIYWTGINCVKAVVEFNQNHSEQGTVKPPRVNVIRLPIVSGGTFLHPEVSVFEAALALIWGAGEALRVSPPAACPKVELMPEKAMKDAYRTYFEEGARPSDWNTEARKFLFANICA